ncbi:MAG: hypothetical protein DMF82_04415 [Acidobacteria bacterium]|nr:MAG: hypothetical protein DMF82_04415 [Acidobacteriota bacterium]
MTDPASLLRSFLASLGRRSRLERDMDAELRFHREARASDLERAGLPRAEAERRARLEFGSVEGYKEGCREARGLRWPDELRRLGAFSDLAAFATYESSLTGAGEPVRALRSEVTPSLFPLLGVAPALGRVFRDGEEQGASGALAVISDGLWRERFRADRGVIGRVENVDGVPSTIVGVMPTAFNFPPRTELWTPLRIRPAYRDNAINRVVGRLASGIGREQALAQARTLMAAVGRTLPPAKRNGDVSIVGLQESLVGKARPLLLVLLGAVGFVLLIACANMASLLMARAAARRQEMSLRAILGAGRGRLLRQMLTESLALAVLGGIAGLALARASLPVLLASVPPNMLPRIDEVRVDAVVAAAAGALCLGTGVLFGLAPALWGSRRDLGRSRW